MSQGVSMFNDMTKLEYFAGLAMQGYCANPTIGNEDDDAIASISICVAQELMKQLEEEH